MTTKTNKNNANIGFEKQLWDAACVLWGHIPVWSSDSSFIDNSVSENIYFLFVLLKK